MMRITQAVFLLCLFSPFLAFGEAKIYVYKEADGAIRFSSHPPKKGGQAKVFRGKRDGFSWYRVSGVARRTRLFREKYHDIISSASESFGVDAALVRAIIHTESAFNPRAVSPKGAVGLMQIMPVHFQRLGIRDPFQPQENIRGGVRILAGLYERYKGNNRLVLAAYNAGEKAVERYHGVPPYRETQNYVTKVLKLWSRYKGDR